MQPFRDRLCLIDDCSTDYTSALIRQAGFRCIRGERNRKKPGAIRTLLDALPPEVETVVGLDPDVVMLASGPSTGRAWRPSSSIFNRVKPPRSLRGL